MNQEPQNISSFFAFIGLLSLITGSFVFFQTLQALNEAGISMLWKYALPIGLPLLGTVLTFLVSAFFYPSVAHQATRFKTRPNLLLGLAMLSFLGLAAIWVVLAYFRMNNIHRLITFQAVFLAVWLTFTTGAAFIFLTKVNFPDWLQFIKNSWLRFLFPTWPILLLTGQNLAIFWQHYFKDVGFPWDFSLSYYAIVAFWTTAVSQGVLPEWIPFQQMGYPFALNLQTGYNYPPFWVFPLLRIPYTLNTAVVFQCLHVLFGALGAYLFFQQVFKNRSLAVVGAFAFQFFGGFYSNSQHADIVRAFAIMPWMFYAFRLQTPRMSWSNLLIPLAILFLATGGYPGNLIAMLFFMGLYLICQILSWHYQHRSWIQTLHTMVWVGVMTALGIGLATPQLGPGWLEREWLLRYNVIPLNHHGLGLEHLPALFLSNRLVTGESMSSVFVTLPIVALLFLISWNILRRQWLDIGLCILAALMTAGPRTPVWIFLSGLLPPLRYSRFPPSDYRGIATFLLIFLAIGGLASLYQHEISFRNLLGRSFLFGSFSLYMLYLTRRGMTTEERAEVIVIGLISILLLLLVLKFSTAAWGKSLILLLWILIAWDGARVLPTILRWDEPNFDTFYDRMNWPLVKEGQLITYNIFQRRVEHRPERLPLEGLEYAWRGLITGDFVLGDLGPYILGSSTQAIENPIYREFMSRAWMPILEVKPDNWSPDGFSISMADLERELKLTLVENQIKQTLYGINEITYQVNLPEARILIENEIYFPGWEAELLFANKRQTISAFPSNVIFRAWLLPSGQYQMRAHFTFPKHDLFTRIAIASLIAWLGIGTFKFIKQRTHQHFLPGKEPQTIRFRFFKENQPNNQYHIRIFRHGWNR